MATSEPGRSSIVPLVMTSACSFSRASSPGYKLLSAHTFGFIVSSLYVKDLVAVSPELISFGCRLWLPLNNREIKGIRIALAAACGRAGITIRVSSAVKLMHGYPHRPVADVVDPERGERAFTRANPEGLHLSGALARGV